MAQASKQDSHVSAESARNVTVKRGACSESYLRLFASDMEQLVPSGERCFGNLPFLFSVKDVGRQDGQI